MFLTITVKISAREAVRCMDRREFNRYTIAVAFSQWKPNKTPKFLELTDK